MSTGNHSRGNKAGEGIWLVKKENKWEKHVAVSIIIICNVKETTDNEKSKEINSCKF